MLEALGVDRRDECRNKRSQELSASEFMKLAIRSVVMIRIRVCVVYCRRRHSDFLSMKGPPFQFDLLIFG